MPNDNFLKIEEKEKKRQPFLFDGGGSPYISILEIEDFVTQFDEKKITQCENCGIFRPTLNFLCEINFVILNI